MHNQISLDENLEYKLTKVYVALAMTRNVATLGLNTDSMVKLLDVASKMLEEILDTDSTPQTTLETMNELELLM